MNAERIRQLDIDHNTKVLGLMQDGQEYKTFCFAKQGWATAVRNGEQFSVKLPGTRRPQTMSLDATVAALVTAHHG